VTAVGGGLFDLAFVILVVCFGLSWIEWFVWLSLSPRLKSYGVAVLQRTRVMPRPLPDAGGWLTTDRAILRVLGTDSAAFRHRISFWSYGMSQMFPIHCRVRWQDNNATIVGRVPCFSLFFIAAIPVFLLVGSIVTGNPILLLFGSVFGVLGYATYAIERERTLAALEELAVSLQRDRGSNTALQPTGGPGQSLGNGSTIRPTGS
jgi:hypothetical protein